MAQIRTGSSMPDLQLLDAQNKVYNLRQQSNGKACVVYFYPKDDTPGCTAEACSFRDSYQDFVDIGALVIGISSDSPESHRKFAAKHKLPFVLLSDAKKEARQAFGVPSDLLGLIPGRVTYVFNPQGVCVGVYKSQLNAQAHVSEALKLIKQMKP